MAIRLDRHIRQRLWRWVYTPHGILLLSSLASLLAWLLPGGEHIRKGFEHRSPLLSAGTSFALLWSITSAALAWLGYRLGSALRWRAPTLDRYASIDSSAYFVFVTAVAVIAVSYTYWRLTAGLGLAGILGAVAGGTANLLKDELYADYQVGLFSLRYVAILAGALALYRLTVRRRLGLAELVAIACLLLEALLASRLSLVAAMMMGFGLVARSRGMPRFGVARVAVGVVVIFLVLAGYNYTRNAGFYEVDAMDRFVWAGMSEIVSYLGAPFQGAATAGNYFGELAGAGVGSHYAYSGIEVELTTNSAALGLLERGGLPGLAAGLLVLTALAFAMGAVASHSRNYLGLGYLVVHYCFAEFWRVFFFLEGIVITLLAVASVPVFLGLLAAALARPRIAREVQGLAAVPSGGGFPPEAPERSSAGPGRAWPDLGVAKDSHDDEIHALIGSARSDSAEEPVVLVDGRWRGPHGIGRFATEVIARLGPMRVAFLPEGRSPSSALDPLWSALWVARRRPDVFFQPGYNPPLRAAAPFVFTIHDLNHLEIPANSSPIKRAYYTLLIRPACRRAFRVLTVSEFSRRAIVAWSGVPADRVINVGNGVGSEFSPEGPSHQPGYRYFLYVGNRKPHKNLPRLLEGYARSGVSDRHVLLLSGDPEPSILRLLPQLGLTGERIRFAGPINDEDLPAYYRGASALLLPSLYEGFGLPALEAMACGTPVIVGDAAALPEIVSGAGLLVEPTSGDSIAAGIRGLDANAGLRRRLRVLGLDRARHYSWEETARRVRSVLHDAIQAC